MRSEPTASATPTALRSFRDDDLIMVAFVTVLRCSSLKL